MFDFQKLTKSRAWHYYAGLPNASIRRRQYGLLTPQLQVVVARVFHDLRTVLIGSMGVVETDSGRYN